MGEDDKDEEEEVVRKGDDAKAHKELNKLGGDMDEKEVDTGKAENALSSLASAEQAEKARKLERERELAKVKVERQDIELVMAGMLVHFVLGCTSRRATSW